MVYTPEIPIMYMEMSYLNMMYLVLHLENVFLGT
jgi:hypothetical protein